MKTNLSEYKKIILNLAAIYDHGNNINEQILEFQARHLSKWEIKDVAKGATAYMDDLKNNYFPRPIHAIMKYVYPEISERDNAVAIASKIWSAVGKFSLYQYVEAQEFIGEAGWEVVKQRGGWRRICDDCNNTEPGIMQAQLRDLAESTLRRSKAGQLENKISLPGPNSNKVSQIVGQTMKSLGGSK